jgi:putative ABC transport system permease protein
VATFRRFFTRFANLFTRRMADREFEAELASHPALMQNELERRGLSPERARREARLKLGGIEQAKEAHREARTLHGFETLAQDVRFALRMLRKNPGFTAVAILTLALGIGANTAIFSAVNGIVLKPLPYANSSQLVSVMGVRRFTATMEGTMTFSSDIWKEVQRQTPAIAQMALYENLHSVPLTGGVVPRIVPAATVSDGFFPLMGAQPLIGRPILAEDTQPGAKPVAVVSYDLWRATWGADPSLLGRTAQLDGKPYEVVGVMPPDFIFPASSGTSAIWLPMIIPPGQDSTSMAVARLQPGVSIQAANAQLRTVSSRLSGEFRGFGEGGYFYATGVKRRFGDLDDEMLVLLGAVGFVLLIACVNVSGLLLARSWSRQREVAVREALGATRLRIVRQFLTESILLAFAGGALGLLFGFWGVQVLRAISPAGTQEHGQFRLDAHMLWFTAAISLLTGLLFGLAPAIQVSGRQISATLKEQMGGSPGGFQARRIRTMRGLLAVIEIAFAVVLVIGAALAARSLNNLTSIRLGFRTDHIMTMKGNFSTATCGAPKGGNLAGCWPVVSGALRNVREVPGVESAAVASTLPMSPWAVAFSVQIEGEPKQLSLGSGEVIADRIISTDYFRTLGMQLLSGREFLDTDVAGGNRVSIVDELFAREYLGDHALGRRISYRSGPDGKPEWTEIVGIVSSAHDLRAKEELRPEIYIPFAQATYFQGANFLTRTSDNPAEMTPALQRAIWAVDNDVPLTDLATMDQIVRQSAAEPRYQTLLLTAFGGVGLLLAMVGVYGVISYGVSQRSQEIGVRMALGAQRSNILRMVIGEGMLLVLIGIIAGIAGALALGRFLQSMLFEIKPTDPATFVGVGVALALAALAACYIPARRAMRVDPVAAMRWE